MIFDVLKDSVTDDFYPKTVLICNKDDIGILEEVIHAPSKEVVDIIRSNNKREGNENVFLHDLYPELEETLPHWGRLIQLSIK